METMGSAAKTARKSLRKNAREHSSQANPNQATKPEPSLKQSLPGKQVDQLFTRMQSKYGHLWSSRFGSVDAVKAGKLEWGHALAGASHEQLSEALRRLDEDHPMPPSLCEFKRLVFRSRRSAPYHRMYKRRALPPPRNPMKAKKHLDELRGILCGAAKGEHVQ